MSKQLFGLVVSITIKKEFLSVSWHNQGKEAGLEAGLAAGKAAGKAEDVLVLLEELGEVPENLRAVILNESDLELLKKWLREAAKADTIQRFLDETGL